MRQRMSALLVQVVASCEADSLWNTDIEDEGAVVGVVVVGACVDNAVGAVSDSVV